jgi:hypothetical protein
MDHETNSNHIDPYLDDTIRNIIDVLTLGFSSKCGKIPFNLRISVWSILEALSNYPDPTPDRETKRKEDYAELSPFWLSSIRGQALNAIIRYALWVRDCTENSPEPPKISNQGFDLMPEVREILEAHLDLNFDPSLAVRAIYGVEFLV